MKTSIFILAMMFGFNFAALADTDYVVRAGDTLLKISDRLIAEAKGAKTPNRYVLARRISSLNPQLKDRNQLTPGETIKLPDVGVSTTKPVVAKAEPMVVTPEPPAAPAISAPATELGQPPVMAPVAVTEPPPAEALPAPTPEVHSVDHGHHPSHLLVQLRAHMNDYEIENKATHEHLKVHSKVIAGLGLGYAMPIGEKTFVMAKAGMNYAQLDNFGAGNQLNDRAQWMKNFALGIEYHWLHSLRIELMAMYNDHLFILPTDVNTYSVNNVATPGAELVLDWAFWERQTYIFGLTAAAEYSGSANKNGVKYKSAVEPVASLYWASLRGHENINYRAAATYTLSGQSAEGDIHQHMSSFGVSFGLIFPF